MIIWGSKVRVVKGNSGYFDCPRCGSRQPFEQMRAARYFTLYFVPLFETASLGEFARCLTCRSEFQELSASGAPSEDAWTCPECSSSNPGQAFQCRRCGFRLV